MSSENKHEMYMREALKVAEEALQRGELPIGAIIVSGDTIIARAFAKDKELKQRIAHAEMLALMELDSKKPFPGKRGDIQLYTTLEPCMMCLGAALVTDVSQIYFALESKTDGAADLYKNWEKDPTEHVGCREVQITGGILRTESQALFRKFCELYPTGGFGVWAKTLI